MTIERHAAAIGDRLDGAPCLIMLDVDGTLAPIAPTPEQAAIPAATRDVLRRLASDRDVVMAFVSGRAAQDTWRMTGLPRTLVAGNHGAELRDVAGEIRVHPTILEYEAAVAAAAASLEKELLPVRGAFVENKRWTVSVHYRLVSDTDVPHLVERAGQVAIAHGLRVMDGKKIVELRPPVAVHKGTAVAELVAGAGVSASIGSAMYAGDDRTDEDAFRALRSLVPHAVTIRVADGRTETAAELVVAGTDEFRELLDWLATRRASRDAAPD